MTNPQKTALQANADQAAQCSDRKGALPGKCKPRSRTLPGKSGCTAQEGAAAHSASPSGPHWGHPHAAPGKTHGTETPLPC